MSLFSYNAKITAVHDGDTVTADVDLGFGVWIRGMRIRLDRINAPELNTPDGKLSRNFLADTVLDMDVTIQTRRTSAENAADAQEKYGRYVATIFTLPPADINVNELLVTRGFAVHKVYTVENLK